MTKQILYEMPWNNSRNDFENALYDSQYPDENADGGVQLDHSKLYVTNLPKNLNEQGLTALFSKYGNIVKIHLSRDPTKRYAFIFFEAASQARVAMMKLNRTEPLKLNIAIAHKKNSQDQNENNNSRSSRNFDRRSMADDYGSEGRSNNWNNSDCQNDAYEELLDDELEMEQDLDLDVRIQMLNLKEAEIKLKKKILFLNQHKKMNQQSQHGNRSILPDGRIVVQNIGERAPVQENFSSAPDDSKTPSSCEESPTCVVDREQKYQHEDKSNRKDSGEVDSTLKCCHDIDDGILQEITEAVFDEYCDIDIPLDVVVDHRNEVGCDESNVCDIHRLRANDYEDVDGDLKFVIAFTGYPKAKIQLHDIKRFSQCVKDIIGIQKASNFLRNSPTFRDCYINNGAIVCVFNDSESKRWLLMVLPGIKERMNCDFLLMKCETIRLWLTLIVSPVKSSKFVEKFLQKLQNLNPDLKTGQWKIVKKINVSNIDYISIVIDKNSYEIIRSSTFKNVIDFNEMEFEIEGSIDIYGKTLSFEDDFSSIASRVEILKSLNAVDTKFVKHDEKKLSKASDLHEMKDIKKEFDESYEINIEKTNILKNLRVNDYNEIIIDELKIVVALSDYPMSKINLRHMELFNKSFNDIIDMQKESNLLKNTPKFLDCYINKGAIVCIFNDLDSKQWFVRVSPGLQERMNCRLKFFRPETTRLFLAEMKIQEGLCPTAVIDVFKNMQLFNPKIHKDNFKIISKQCINGKIHALHFLIDSISYETVRSFTFQNVVDSDKIQFRVKAGEIVYYRNISFEPDLSSFQSRIKLLKDLKPDVFKVSDPKRNISTENDKPDECDESNIDEDSSDEVYNSSSTKTAVSPRSEELITEDSSDKLYTERAERRLQKELNSKSPNIKSDESGSVIEGEDILTNSSMDGISNLEETCYKESLSFPDTYVKESDRLLNSSLSESAVIRDNVLCEIITPNNIQKTSIKKLSEDCSKINTNRNISNSWELRVRNSKAHDKENVNEIEFENPNIIDNSNTENTDKFNNNEKMENVITVGDVKSEQTLKIVYQEIVNNDSSMDDIDSNENVTVNEISSASVNSVNESPNVAIYISSDLNCENPEIDEVSTCESLVLVKNENRSSPEQQIRNSNKIVDSSDLDRAICDELDDQNESHELITSELYVHKDFKNVAFTGDIDFKSAANIDDNILFGATDYSNRYRRKELSYYRCTNYLHVDKELKLAVVLEDYPTAKLQKSHMRQISRLFNECLSEDEELFDDDIIPQFEDVYVSNGAIVFICENMDTKEYFVEVLPDISTSLGLKLKLHNIARLFRFYRVSMTLPLEISQLESKAMLPALQQSYTKLQTNVWKIYSDVPGEQTRVFGVDGSSLRFLRKSNMTLEYEGHIITCEEVKKPRPDIQPNVINTDTAEEIEKNFKDKIIKMMYCELETSGKKTSLNDLRNKNRKNNYTDTIPDDFKLYISATEYPEVRIDEINFNEIKQAFEDLVADTWGTYDAFIPRIYDMYLCEGAIFVICKDIQTRFWIESNIRNIDLSLNFNIKATEYRGVVGIVNMKIKSKKSFEEVVAILQNQNPRLRTKFWRQTTTKTNYPQVVLQMDSLSAQVIRSDSFNGNIDGQTPEFDFGYLLSIIKRRPSLEPFSSDDYKNITNDADIDVANKENYKCDKCLNENDIFYYSGNENYNIMEQMGAIDDEDYCKVDLKIPPVILTAKGCLDVIFGVLTEKNPKLNTFLWKIEPSSDVGHVTVFVDKSSAQVMKEDGFDPSFAGENLEFQF